MPAGPERTGPRPSRLAQRATQRLVQLLDGEPFVIAYHGGRNEDRYGRKLRVIERNGRSVRDMMVAEGSCAPLGRRATKLVQCLERDRFRLNRSRFVYFVA